MPTTLPNFGAKQAWNARQLPRLPKHCTKQNSEHDYSSPFHWEHMNVPKGYVHVYRRWRGCPAVGMTNWTSRNQTQFVQQQATRCTHHSLGALHARTLARLNQTPFLDALEALQGQHGAAAQPPQPTAHLITCLHLQG